MYLISTNHLRKTFFHAVEIIQANKITFSFQFLFVEKQFNIRQNLTHV